MRAENSGRMTSLLCLSTHFPEWQCIGEILLLSQREIQLVARIYKRWRWFVFPLSAVFSLKTLGIKSWKTKQGYFVSLFSISKLFICRNIEDKLFLI
jgi:hypothetical protein